ncbi:hypothetical protein [Microbacterium sp. NPDC097977]|uniref:hypothetical protein n=1 Tax=Microbacterium sp. NPDC097977 TaxID=3155686 RepID=UPI00332AD6F1
MTLNDRTQRTSSRILMALPIAALAFSLAACGGAAPERPSAQQVADGLTSVLEDQGLRDSLSDDVVLCLSEALVDSEVSNESLDAIAKGDENVKTDQKEGALVQKTINDAAPDCAPTE